MMELKLKLQYCSTGWPSYGVQDTHQKATFAGRDLQRVLDEETTPIDYRYYRYHS